MHNAALVHVRHSRDKLSHDGRRLWLSEVFLLPDAVKQFTSTEQLHHYVSVQLYTIFTHTEVSVLAYVAESTSFMSYSSLQKLYWLGTATSLCYAARTNLILKDILQLDNSVMTLTQTQQLHLPAAVHTITDDLHRKRFACSLLNAFPVKHNNTGKLQLCQRHCKQIEKPFYRFFIFPKKVVCFNHTCK